jgi:hypothetical protein
MGATVLLLAVIVSIVVVCVVPVIVGVAVLSFIVLFAFAFALWFVVVCVFIVVVIVCFIVRVVVVIIVVVHRERGGNERIEASFFFHHFVVSEPTGRVPVELRSFFRWGARRAWPRRRARRAQLAKLFTSHRPIPIAIELAKGRRRTVNFRGAQRTVSIGIEQSQQSTWWRTRSPSKAGPAWRPIAAKAACIRTATLGTAPLWTTPFRPTFGTATFWAASATARLLIAVISGGLVAVVGRRFGFEGRHRRRGQTGGQFFAV